MHILPDSSVVASFESFSLISSAVFTVSAEGPNNVKWNYTI